MVAFIFLIFNTVMMFINVINKDMDNANFHLILVVYLLLDQKQSVQINLVRGDQASE